MKLEPKWMNGKMNKTIIPLTHYDEYYLYDGHVLVNELYEDSDGFNKNTWLWGRMHGSYVISPIALDGLSSNSYAKIDEAYNVFKSKVDQIVS